MFSYLENKVVFYSRHDEIEKSSLMHYIEPLHLNHTYLQGEPAQYGGMCSGRFTAEGCFIAQVGI